MTFIEILAKFWPLLALQLVLMAAGLIDLSRRKTVKHLPRVAWIVIIVIVGCLGPLLYFAAGRGEE